MVRPWGFDNSSHYPSYFRPTQVIPLCRVFTSESQITTPTITVTSATIMTISPLPTMLSTPVAPIIPLWTQPMLPPSPPYRHYHHHHHHQHSSNTAPPPPPLYYGHCQLQWDFSLILPWDASPMYCPLSWPWLWHIFRHHLGYAWLVGCAPLPSRPGQPWLRDWMVPGFPCPGQNLVQISSMGISEEREGLMKTKHTVVCPSWGCAQLRSCILQTEIVAVHCQGLPSSSRSTLPLPVPCSEMCNPNPEIAWHEFYSLLK